MSLFRYCLGRMLGGVLALGLFALFCNALILSNQQFMASEMARSGPPPALVPLKDARIDAGVEVNALARVDAVVDVALPDGTGRLFLLADPAAAAGSAAQVAVFVAPADVSVFEAMLSDATGAGGDKAPVIALNGLVTPPFWIDRAGAAAAESQHPLAADMQFVRPFLHGRDAGLAPSLLALLVPALSFALLVCVVWSEIRSMAARYRRRDRPRAVTLEFPGPSAYLGR